jgi:hypothetical protein
MFKASVKITKKAHLNMGAFYLRKYIGVKELILFVVLIIAGMVIAVLSDQPYVMWIAIGSVAMCGICVLLYLVLTAAGYKKEFAERHADKWEFQFNDGGFVVELYENDEKTQYTEKFAYENCERIAIRPAVIYMFFGAAIQYYIPRESLTEGEYAELCKFLEDVIPVEKFKMKAKMRRFSTRDKL